MITFEEIIKTSNAEPRPYQRRIVEKACNCFLDKNLRSVLIESPTGSGKTIMALLIAKALHLNGIRIGWVAMRRHLLHQVQRENKEKGFEVPLTFISMFEKNPPVDLDMLIVDEAQHDVTSSMAHIHALVEPKYILGMTATPFRADRVKLCFDTVLKDAGIPTLIQDGYLSSYHHYSIPKWGVEEVVNHYVAEPERWGKSIIYFHRLEQCFAAAALLRQHGFVAEVVHGGSDTETQIDNFHNNKINVLLNCMKLTEGFDCPDLKTVFCRPSCKAVTIQMAGRVLRKHPTVTIKQVVQSVKTPYPFEKTALPTLQHVRVGDDWRTLTVNKQIDAINQKMIRALAKSNPEMPDYIKKAKRNNPRWNPRQPTAESEARRDESAESYHDISQQFAANMNNISE